MQGRDLDRATRSEALPERPSASHEQDLDTDYVEEYDDDGHEPEPYILRHFKRHRVFVGVEDFMKNVLHVPDDWKTRWGPTIEQVKANKLFQLHHGSYSNRCDISSSEEEPFYELLVGMLNVILHVTRKSPLGSIKPKTPQCHTTNDSEGVLYRALKEGNLSQDIGVVHKHLPHHPKQNRLYKRRLYPSKSNQTRAQPVQVLEVKRFHGGLIDGSCIPRLRGNGQDPHAEHARPSTKLRYLKKKHLTPTPRLSTLKEVHSTALEMPTTVRKRPADECSDPRRKVPKRRSNSTPSDANSQTGEQTHTSTLRPRTGDTCCQKNACIQICNYVLEQFTIPSFRLHTTTALIDRNRIQFYHANHSVILVSSAISIGINDEMGGLDKMVAIVIAFSRLSLRDKGILHNPYDGNLSACDLNPGVVRVWEGRRLEFGGDGKIGPFVLTYGEVIYHESSLVGRGTTVLHATSPKWQDADLVVKICWPDTSRGSESEFLWKAIKEAECSTDKWALKHLPALLFAQDVISDSDLTHKKVSSLFNGANFVSGEYKYEERTLRIVVQERLYPLTTLSDVKDIAQVLLDIACVHRWLYEKAGILHGDLSLRNIMYRRINGKVYGVLTDFDLSFWTASLVSGCTLQQRTGTPPYMAYELLEKTDCIHLYRHDLESLLYIMATLVTRYEIEDSGEGSEKKGRMQMREGLQELPFQNWFDQLSYEVLGCFKFNFCTTKSRIDLSPKFEDLGGWLRKVHLAFKRGVLAKNNHLFLVSQQADGDGQSGDETIPQFDDETLGGHVHYSAFIEPARNLKGKLAGLTVRYESESIASPNTLSADAISSWCLSWIGNWWTLPSLLSPSYLKLLV